MLKKFFIFFLCFLLVSNFVFTVKSDLNPTLMFSINEDPQVDYKIVDRVFLSFMRGNSLYFAYSSNGALKLRSPDGSITTLISSPQKTYRVIYYEPFDCLIYSSGTTSGGIYFYYFSNGTSTLKYGFSGWNVIYNDLFLIDNKLYSVIIYSLSGSYYRDYRVYNINNWQLINYHYMSYTGNHLFTTAFPIKYTNGTYFGVGSIVITSTNIYLFILKNDGSAFLNIYLSGTVTITNYPIRIINCDLTYDLNVNGYKGSLTLLSSDENNLGIVTNIYFSSGINPTLQVITIPKPEGGIGYGKGGIWSYKVDNNVIGISFYKALYSDKYRFDVTLTYNDEGRITTSQGSQVTDNNYPVSLNPIWITELNYISSGESFLNYWLKTHGDTNYISGNIRIEFSNYPSNILSVYSLFPSQAQSGGSSGGGVGESGRVTAYTNINQNTFYYFKLTFPSSSEIKIKTLGIDVNSTVITNPNVLQFRIYTENDLKFQYNVTINQNGTFRVLINPDQLVGNGNIRLGVIWYEGDYLQLGYGTPNEQTFAKVLPIDNFIQEGSIQPWRGSWTYLYEDLKSGIGTGGSGGTGIISSNNYTYVYDYNGTNPVGSQVISTPNTQFANQVRNYFIEMGYGDIGGIVVLLIMSFALGLAFSKFISSSDGFIGALGISSIFCFTLGFLELNIFAGIILILIVMAGKKIFFFQFPL
ncbi:MAG: hypothetical protein QXM39_04275 [Thermoplasmata archaeon]